MYEKVNPSHPDKIADRIAGAIVDKAYAKTENPRIAVEVLIGHRFCTVIIETSVHIDENEIRCIVDRIAGAEPEIRIIEVEQDPILSNNQATELRCGDNGIFKGVPVTAEQSRLTSLVKRIYDKYPYDGKYIIDSKSKTVYACQSHARESDINAAIWDSAVEDSLYDWNTVTNPLGYWEGGTDVDSGATNRKLGSDMGDAVTGGGLHGKDLSKADVTLNIYCHLMAMESGKPYELNCHIGQRTVDGLEYSEIVRIAKDYIDSIGGFEKFAEWGLISPSEFPRKTGINALIKDKNEKR